MVRIGKSQFRFLGGIELAVALVCIQLVGCGGDHAAVSGTVSLDGKRMLGDRDHRVTVMFVPESGSGATTAALLDENGSYTLATGSQGGIKPGAYLVAISGVDVIRSADGSAPPGVRQITPKRFADPKESGFRADVQPGSNNFDFELKSGPTS
jgi:hypothetical protein